ncbi:MAG: response regulator [Alphaproteobacteria bacterium]|nr:response regulator [Alphaproteobacteria bacterium]MDP6830395.1 response regulator [Alphaproteobacteria bacterium]MDP6875550.1 response regulator [Alphaproteobacteria bacterium]
MIDDEPAFCRFVQSVGKLLDFDVQTSGSGKDIMSTEAPLPWDAIVLDIVMPDVDGIEIIRWLSKVDYRGRLLVVSGYAPNYARMACVLADAGGSMEVDQHSKPISIEQLRAALS